jgi:alpha-tubulin suppressor-like RCC1 family protein
VNISSSIHFVQISAGEARTLALTDNGTVWGFGYKMNSGLNTGLPLIISASNIIKVSASYNAMLLLDINGNVYSFGEGSNGQLCQGGTTTNWVPTLITGIPRIMNIVTSVNRVALIASNKTLYMCGLNEVTQLFNLTFQRLDHLETIKQEEIITHLLSCCKMWFLFQCQELIHLPKFNVL